MSVDYGNNQGCINAKVTGLADDKEALTAYMASKTEKQKEEARKHLKTVLSLRNKPKRGSRNE